MQQRQARPRLIQAMIDAFSLPDLRLRLLFTLGVLIVFRFLAHIPVPGVDQTALDEAFKSNQLLGMLDLFSGGAMRNFSIVAMGVYPYITATIVMQLLQPVIPQLRNLAMEGEAGRNKINTYTHRLVVIYGAGLLAEVAQRWKSQLNENSKTWAFHEIFPELNHNAVVGYQLPSELRDRILVVLLHSSLLHQRVSIRYQLTTEILNKASVKYKVLEATGESRLAQMMSLVLYGDYVSFYLAILNGVDPTQVISIDYLKSRLAEY